MLSFLLSSVLVTSPFQFEAKRGLGLEPVVGINLTDQIDSEAGIGGFRLTYLTPNQKDAFVSPELAGHYVRIFESDSQRPRTRFYVEPSIVFYEIYNPYTLRVALTGGIERRDSDWRGLMGIRGGIGRMIVSSFTIWVDFTQRIVFRSTNSFPLDLTLGTQFVF